MLVESNFTRPPSCVAGILRSHQAREHCIPLSHKPQPILAWFEAIKERGKDIILQILSSLDIFLIRPTQQNKSPIETTTTTP